MIAQASFQPGVHVELHSRGRLQATSAAEGDLMGSKQGGSPGTSIPVAWVCRSQQGHEYQDGYTARKLLQLSALHVMQHLDKAVLQFAQGAVASREMSRAKPILMYDAPVGDCKAVTSNMLQAVGAL
jgi:hypothetical protein